MILVDNQGDGDYLYPPVAGMLSGMDVCIYRQIETDWNGLSSADFVFPFFLFIAGIKIQYDT